MAAVDLCAQEDSKKLVPVIQPLDFRNKVIAAEPRNTRKRLLIWLACLVAAMTSEGCSLLSRVPSEFGAIVLDTRDSACVHVGYVAIKRSKDSKGYIVTGDVTRQYYARTTARTELHVVFLDASGKVLLDDPGRFQPREIRDWKVRGEPEPKADFAIPFESVPPQTVTIEVRAVDMR